MQHIPSGCRLPLRLGGCLALGLWELESWLPSVLWLPDQSLPALPKCTQGGVWNVV